MRGRGGVGWKAQPPLDRTTGISDPIFAILNADTVKFPTPPQQPDPSQSLLGHSLYARHYGFGSMHPGGVNFAFADGSVQNIPKSTDWQLLYALFGGYDGSPVNLEF